MVLSRLSVKDLVKGLRWYSKKTKTYYEVLKVDRNASSKEIRESFVKLSKELHPDKRPNDPLSHSEFVKLNEAYMVLSKLKTRKMYDNQLNRHFGSREHWKDEPMSDVYHEFRQFKRRQYEEQQFYDEQDESFAKSNIDSVRHRRRKLVLWLLSATISFILVATLYEIYAPNHHSDMDEILKYFKK